MGVIQQKNVMKERDKGCYKTGKLYEFFEGFFYYNTLIMVITRAITNWQLFYVRMGRELWQNGAITGNRGPYDQNHIPSRKVPS